MIKILMVRHFATSGNIQKRYVGRTEEPVIMGQNTDRMVAELQRIPDMKEVEVVYTSPMLRCIQTTELLFPSLEPKKIFDFRECDFGAFEYKNYEELKDDLTYQKWLDSEGMLPFPDGESRVQFQIRCQKAFDQILNQTCRENVTKIALVVHGGTIMSILDAYSDPHKDYYAWQIENGKGYRMEYKDYGRLSHICMLQ